MADPIKIRIRGSDGDTDAPTVEDFVEQIKDLVEILHGVEAALDGKGQAAIEWRITSATTNSPIALEATPFSRHHGVNIDARARQVRHHTARGLEQLRTSSLRPTYFNEPVLARAKKISHRVTNGLALTEVNFGDGEPDFVLTPSVAREVERNVSLVLQPPKARPYKEKGALEGYFGGVEHDGHGRPILWVQARLTGDRVKCFLAGEANDYVRKRQVAEVLDGRRVRIFGMLHFKGPRKLDHITASKLQVMRGRDQLPSLDEVTDRSFTKGMKSEDYLEALRDGRLH